MARTKALMAINTGVVKTADVSKVLSLILMSIMSMMSMMSMMSVMWLVCWFYVDLRWICWL